MKLSFEQLMEEVWERSPDELYELANLARHYAIEKRRTEIAENVQKSKEEWQSGKLIATDDIDELMNSLEGVE